MLAGYRRRAANSLSRGYRVSQMYRPEEILMTIFYKKIIWLNLSVITLFVIDRVSKWLAMNVLPREGIFVIPGMTGFVLERNQGIAYSISLPLTFLLIVVIIIILVLMALLIRAYRRGEVEVVMAFSLIIAGAVSNLLDRLQYDYVVDMLVLTSWPVFNLADLMILAGAVWLVIKIARKQKKV